MSIAHDIIMASSDTVGELVSVLFIYSYRDLPSAHPLALSELSHFSLIKIRYWSVCYLFSYFV